MPRTPQDRFELRPGHDEQRALLDLVYPAAEAPWVEDIRAAYLQAGRDMIRHKSHGGLPPDIWRSLCSVSEGGLITIFVDDGVGFAPLSGGGALRIDINVEEETEVMAFEELDDAEWREMLGDPDIAEALLAALTRFGHIVDAEELVRRGLAREDVNLTPAVLRELADEFEA